MKLIDINNSGQRWFASVAVAISLLAIGGDNLAQLLAYHRDYISSGEFWRLLTGHLVHSNTWHYLLNLASLLFIGALFGQLLSGAVWATAFVFCGLSISGIYWFFAPGFTSYVGLSAVLYGVIIIGAIQDLPKNKLIAIALIIIVTGRVIWQQFDGASESLTELVENRVAIESHLFGIITGYLFSLLLFLKNVLNKGDSPPPPN